MKKMTISKYLRAQRQHGLDLNRKYNKKAKSLSLEQKKRVLRLVSDFGSRVTKLKRQPLCGLKKIKMGKTTDIDPLFTRSLIAGSINNKIKKMKDVNIKTNHNSQRDAKLPKTNFTYLMKRTDSHNKAKPKKKIKTQSLETKKKSVSIIYKRRKVKKESFVNLQSTNNMEKFRNSRQTSKKKIGESIRNKQTKVMERKNEHKETTNIYQINKNEFKLKRRLNTVNKMMNDLVKKKRPVIDFIKKPVKITPESFRLISNRQISLEKTKLSRTKVINTTLKRNILNIDPVFKLEQLLYAFTEHIYKNRDIYDIFKEYLDFIQDHDFSDLVNKIAYVEKRLQFKNMFILERVCLLISFYIYINRLNNKESKLLKKIMFLMYSNIYVFITSIMTDKTINITYKVS